MFFCVARLNYGRVLLTTQTAVTPESK